MKILNNLTCRLTLCLVLLTPVSAIKAADDKDALNAINSLKDSIDAVALDDGPFSASLFEPLMQLAERQFAFGDSESGRETLKRAQHIAHRNEGVYSKLQLPIIQNLKDLALKEEEYDDANRQQKFAFFVTTHAFEDDHPEVLAAHAELADWYMTTGQPRRARRSIQDAREIAERTDQDILPFHVLENRARRIEGICCNTKRMDRILEDVDLENVLPESLGAMYLEIADNLTLGGKSAQASAYYLKAHELLPLDSADPRPLTIRRNYDSARTSKITAYKVQRDTLSRQRLERMTRQEQLDDEYQPPQWFLMDAEGTQKGFSARDIHETTEGERRTHKLAGHPILFSDDQLNHVLPGRLENNKGELIIELSFTVTETGSLEDIEILNSTAPHRINRLVTKALRKIRYRPALEDGIPVLRENVTLTQTFSSRT